MCEDSKSEMMCSKDDYLTRCCGRSAVIYVFFTSVIFMASSCQKVIDLDLFNSTPRLVVEANITDQPGPYMIRLSKTINFDEITGPQAVSGAEVEITDSAGTREVLTEAGGGIYVTSTLTGTPGHSYKITIKSEGQTYTAVSEMPQPVKDFTPVIIREDGDSHGGGENYHYSVNFDISDPPEFENYYRLVVFHNNKQISSRRVFSDEFNNGKIITGEFHLHDSTGFNPGDEIKIDLQSIDKSAYNFFRTLRDGTSGLSFLSASPSNPLSNITNNGLGYFNACSVTEKFLTIPK